jgi:hypothetical protein
MPRDILAKDTTEVAVVDVVEQIAIDRAKNYLEQRTQMYSLTLAHANTAVYHACSLEIKF